MLFIYFFAQTYPSLFYFIFSGSSMYPPHVIWWEYSSRILAPDEISVLSDTGVQFTNLLSSITFFFANLSSLKCILQSSGLFRVLSPCTSFPVTVGNLETLKKTLLTFETSAGSTHLLFCRNKNQNWAWLSRTLAKFCVLNDVTTFIKPSSLS